MNPVIFAFLLTLGAGLSTGIGALIAFFAKRTNLRFLSVSTGLSAGVMIFVSFVELLPEGIKSLHSWGEKGSMAYGMLSFFAGIGLIFVIDQLVPDAENPHETHTTEEYETLTHAKAEPPPHLLRLGIFTALAITIHNFPEGLATFLSAIDRPSVGVPIAIAVALHNIPEGISVSIPIYYATQSRMRAFVYATLSGLAEPFGAFVLWGVLALFYRSATFTPPSYLMGLTSCAVAGIMVYISLDELLPASRAYGKGHDSLVGLILGMAVMAVSLILL